MNSNNLTEKQATKNNWQLTKKSLPNKHTRCSTSLLIKEMQVTWNPTSKANDALCGD